LDDYYRVFSEKFDVIEIVKDLEEGKQLLNDSILRELADYSLEELTTQRATFILRKA